MCIFKISREILRCLDCYKTRGWFSGAEKIHHLFFAVHVAERDHPYRPGLLGQGDFAKRQRISRASRCIGHNSTTIQRIWSPTVYTDDADVAGVCTLWHAVPVSFRIERTQVAISVPKRMSTRASPGIRLRSCRDGLYPKPQDRCKLASLPNRGRCICPSLPFQPLAD